MKTGTVVLVLWALAGAASAQTSKDAVILTGACDASAALLLPSGHLLVADDEDRERTRLRVYDPKKPGAPVEELDITSALKPDSSDAEVDLEGLTRLGDHMVCLGSHSRKGDDGAAAPSRQRIAELHLVGSAPPYRTEPVGLYTALQADLQKFLDGLAGPRLVLDQEVPGAPGKHKAAKDGGLSIEGVTSTKNAGELLIGFRSPLLPGAPGKEQAFAVLLLNADAVLEHQAAPKFSPPIGLTLDGRGIRDIEFARERSAYLIVAGPAGAGGPFALYEWQGPGAAVAPRQLMAIPADPDTAPEAVVPEAGGTAVWILFDEGERKTASGKRCKSKDVAPADKSFRALRVALAP